ncbi:MAG: dihydroorotase, partial [Raoultibacter sp.]
DYAKMIELMAINPRRVLRVEEVSLVAGSTADLTVIDPDATWVVSVDDMLSKARNSGFIGAELKGQATDVYVGGYATLEEGKIVE